MNEGINQLIQVYPQIEIVLHDSTNVQLIAYNMVSVGIVGLLSGSLIIAIDN